MRDENWLESFFQCGAILPVNQDQFCLAWGKGGDQLWVYAPDFYLEDSEARWDFSDYLILNREEVLEKIAFAPEVSISIPELQWTGPDFLFFKQAFEDLKHRFYTGELSKGVPVVFDSALFQMSPGFLHAFLIQILRYTENTPLNCYGVWDSSGGILGATPELLFSLSSEGILKTAALAGTRLTSLSGKSLLEDAKEVREHRCVVDGIRDSLQDLGELKIGETRELTLPTLTHLHTPIELKIAQRFKALNPTQLFQNLVFKLHPTPALGAAPKDQGWKWLKSYQNKQKRYRFGAPLGFILPNGESYAWVSIRNIQWTNSELLLGAGCGVIEESVLDREWNEIQNKLNSVKKMFGLEVAG